MLRDVLSKIGNEYPHARTQPFSKHPLAQFIRSEATQELRVALGELGNGLICEGGAGAGQFATVPWLAIFDPVITESATRGYYVVFLFSSDGDAVQLSLNQGTTAVREEFRGDAPRVLQDRAALMRARLAEFLPYLPDVAIDLHSTAQLPSDYKAGHALGRIYTIGNLPSEDNLRADLHNAIRAYKALTFRGGLDPSLEAAADDDDPFGGATTLIEKRRYNFHRTIERSTGYAVKVKRHHGTRCQACGFDFASKYGVQLGEGFIEAHHLRPLSSLEEGEVATYTVATDFAVLCSNCHRMIHRMILRMDGPWDVASLQGHIRHS